MNELQVVQVSMEITTDDYLRLLLLLSPLPPWVISKLLGFMNNGRRGRWRRRRMEKTARLYSSAVVLCNVLVSTCYAALCVYGLWKNGTVHLGTMFSGLTWILVTVFSAHCRAKGAGVHCSWPTLLVYWWICTSLSEFLIMSVHLVRTWTGAFIPDFLPSANCVDVISFTLSAAACLLIRERCSAGTKSELEQPLVDDEWRDAATAEDFASAGWWSRITFRWLNPLFEKGRARRLELEHVPPIPEVDSAETAYNLLQESYRKQKHEPVLLPFAIIHCVWKPLAVNALFAGMNTVTSYMGPLLITNFVELLSDTDDSKESRRYGYALACIFLIAKTVESLSQRQWYFGARRIGIRVRAGVMVMIYNKLLLMNSSCAGTGRIINFLDVDVERIGEFFWHIHGIWLLPFQISLALAVLYRSLGAAASLAAVVSTVVVMIGNTPFAKKQEKFHCKIMETKDSRIKAMAEALKYMRILKLHSWENAFLDKILELREVERNWIKRYLYTCSTIAFLFWTSPTLVSVVSFGVCIFQKVPLSAGTVLSALATFRLLQEPIYNLPEFVSMITQTKVSVDRIQGFIKEENTRSCWCNCRKKSEPSTAAVEIEPGEYSWDVDFNFKRPMLKIDRKLRIMKGHKVAVCGPVGSGKSSLLSSIICDIPRISGAESKVFGSTAFVPQSAWIQTGTIRENVLFGKKMNTIMYGEVLEACGLDRDIGLWAHGDMTVVGERGMNLSGGQKQRIQLARAAYSDSDVLLLDDPFSAVDAHTGAHLFKECLMGLMSSKTVIYVTHQLEFVQDADLILVMNEGRIVESGKYGDLISNNHGELLRQMDAHYQSLDQVAKPSSCYSSAKTRCKMKQAEHREIKPCHEDIQSGISEVMYEEERESGRVKWHVYSMFVTSAYKGALVPVIICCHIIFQGLQMGSNYWISWAADRSEAVSKEKLLGVFVLISAVSSLFVLGRAVLLAIVAIETSQKFFQRMTKSIFRASILFFDTTPSSRILNRSSTDQSTVDTDIPFRLAGLVFAAIQLLSVIILISQVAWPVVILFVIIIAISIWYQNYYISTARELARMAGIRKAPILHHFAETIAGVGTIRCFSQEGRFFSKCLELIDDYSCITFHNSASMEWLCVRVNLLFNLVFFSLLVILVSMPKNAVDPSLAGLAATYGLSLNVLQAWVIWNLCNVENKMISVERILQFLDIPSEAPLSVESYRAKEGWPEHGNIEINNLYIQYAPHLPMVLGGITCAFPGEKKIGVVGRTGSGKSTLIQALFRIVEPSVGEILIDGVDITKLGLHDLRSKLSIIPQEPTLFQGTVRTNLDPLQQHTDLEIWEVLCKCRLEDLVRKDQRLLDAPVEEDGGNWSVGQRQLVCLARVLLMKRKILVLDEATASVDAATDNFVQKTIRQETSNCTVITIAHRIPTVIESDLVLVLDEGKILEFDSPKRLLEDRSSAFSKLVAEYIGRSNAGQPLGAKGH